MGQGIQWLFLVSFCAAWAQGPSIAITIDDFPNAGTRQPVKVTNRIIRILKTHKIQSTAGFVNMAKMKNPEDKEVLKNWIAAGNELYNHELDHADLEVVGANNFIKGVDANQNLLDDFQISLGLTNLFAKVFRYPNIHEGVGEDRQIVRAALFDRNYQLAPVTLDSADWAWNDAYARCLDKQDQLILVWIRKEFLAQFAGRALAAKACGETLFHRPLGHLLLMHDRDLTADVLPEVIQILKKYFSIVPMTEILKDPLYSEDPDIAGRGGMTLLEQWARRLQIHCQPGPVLDRAKIEKLCR